MIGNIEVICGSMFSGKTEELIRRLKRAQIGRQTIQTFKPEIDNRYDKNDICSHSGLKIVSMPVKKANDILTHLKDRTRVVGIDEAQFFDEEIIEIANKLANRGLRVLVAGLDMDYLGKPFGPMPGLMAIADEVMKLRAVCVVCGMAASKTHRLSEDQAKILVGSSEYEPRCRTHHGLKNNYFRGFAEDGQLIPTM